MAGEEQENHLTLSYLLLKFITIVSSAQTLLSGV